MRKLSSKKGSNTLFPNVLHMKIYISFKNEEGEIYSFSYTKPIKKGEEKAKKEK